VPVIIRRWRI